MRTALKLAALLAALGPAANTGHAAGLTIVAAENFYGDVARQIAGPAARVTSIVSNPNQDPHQFEASPSIARAIAGADLVIQNGAGYDPWIDKLLAASRSATRRTVVVADLAHRAAGENPHLWYDVDAVAATGAALTEALCALDAPACDGYRARGGAFAASLTPIRERIAGLRARTAGVPVAATEPVFGYMFAALGMVVRDEDFARDVMNDTEPSASRIVAFETDLRTHAVRLLVFNGQTRNPLAERMRGLAARAHIPVLPVTETEPPGTTYQAWMMGALDAVDRALPAAP